MISELQNLLLPTLYVLVAKLVMTDSQTSTVWRLNSDKTKIVEASPFHSALTLPDAYLAEDDPIFNIITSTVHYGESWMKQGEEYFCTNCRTVQASAREKYSKSSFTLLSGSMKAPNNASSRNEPLDCGRPVNFTLYDNLLGVLNRNRHPNVPEPHISLVLIEFKSKVAIRSKKPIQQQIADVEAYVKRENTNGKSLSMYSDIGNFWRMKGNSQKAIECFRKVLAVAPRNANALLSLARVLFTLQYLDDAVFLIKMSLDVQTCVQETWQQHFTLGEIFKAYGHYEEASLHLQRSLQLNPVFEPAKAALKEMQGMPVSKLHLYTVVIIISLVLGVLLVVLSSVGSSEEAEVCDGQPQKHFNRTMAMSTLHGLRIGPKGSRCRKLSA